VRAWPDGAGSATPPFAGVVFRRRGPSLRRRRLSGSVLDGGADWQSVRSDGTTTLDVRLMLKTNDAALIGMSYRGIRHGPVYSVFEVL
jgi:Protein of unknown function (DUF3237)